jgi:KDO2-lipid IV(A) lauroyltransferase
MAYYFLGFLVTPSLTKSDLKSRFRFHDLHFLEKAKSHGRGVLLLSCHMGNPDLALNGLALAGEKIWVISKKFSNSFFNELWFQLRSRPGLNYISAHGRETSYQIFKALGANESVLFVMDQFMSSPYGIESHFFGRKTGTAYGLARFFVKSNAPVVPCYNLEDDKGVCHIYFEEPIWPSVDLIELGANETKEAHTLRLVNLFNHRLEKIIMKAPKHWMWIHRRWKRWTQ